MVESSSTSETCNWHNGFNVVSHAKTELMTKVLGRFWLTDMDKNKSAHKLRGFGPIYYTNLDGQPDRAVDGVSV